jgi:hypothetical protein
MTWQRVEAVFHHAPKPASDKGLAVLLYLAHKSTGRDMSKGVEVSVGIDELALATNAYGPKLGEVVARLASDGIIGRKQIGMDKNGRPVYAHRGQPTTYIIPPWPAPTGCFCQNCRTTTVMTDPGKDPVGGGPLPEQRTPPNGVLTERRTPPNGVLTPRKDPPRGGPCPKEGPPPTGSPTEELPNRTKPTVEAPGRTPGAEPPKWTPPVAPPERPWAHAPETLQLIGDTLAAAGHHPIIEEVRAVSSAFIQTTAPNGIGLYRKIAAEGGVRWAGLLSEIRKDRNREAAEEIKKLTSTEQPPCEHGSPGGRNPHPITGESLCPKCRMGIPADPEQTLDPMLTYRSIYTAATGTEPTRSHMRSIGRQRHELAARGVTPADILTIITGAASTGKDLVTHIKETSNA